MDVHAFVVWQQGQKYWLSNWLSIRVMSLRLFMLNGMDSFLWGDIDFNFNTIINHGADIFRSETDTE